ncbi:glycosyltransferase family 2 protein [Bosea sp. NBC_00550]|uniref:glycosyltransferase family 2 protein n=1 Tax=Bosea sp. NBC_00550 TaxID=2969621 RepID=UPI00222F150B|nr:glycosyltransferase family 2 protein [Bosea sp. NBC_00550]UZF94819.1 glycosyltransferase family 2 protein [Bosea sp. NBC_00550]
MNSLLHSFSAAHTVLPPSPRSDYLSVVIPCFNEEEGLGEALKRVDAACIAAAVPAYEIILIDDGSQDRTWEIISAAGRENPHIVGVRLARNFGHQLALSAGLTIVTGDRIFVLDADLQDPPELLTDMMRLMDEGADVVYGQRQEREGETATKKLTAKLFYRFLAKLTDIDIPVDTGDFRLMSRRVVELLNSMPESNRFIRGMVSWVGFKQVGLPYRRRERFAGTTKYPLKKMLRLAVDAITGFSIKPLRVASYCGAAFGLAGFILMIYVALSWFDNSTIRGWTSLISIVLLLGSAQIIVLGVIGEYIGRLFIQGKGRPNFIISDVTGGGDSVRALPR